MTLIKRITITAIVIFLFSYVSHWILIPTEIIATHPHGTSRIILVKNFPLTVSGKMKWWKENKKLLKDKYDTPFIRDNGSYSVTIWDIGKGYQIKKPRDDTFFPDHDTEYLLCFEEMKVEANCVDKANQIMYIAKTRKGVLMVTANNEMYQETNGRLIKSSITLE